MTITFNGSIFMKIFLLCFNISGCGIKSFYVFPPTGLVHNEEGMKQCYDCHHKHQQQHLQQLEVERVTNIKILKMHSVHIHN